MSDLRYKNQLVERLSYVFGVLLLSGILGVIVSIIANYFVLVVKWFANLRTGSYDFFQFSGLPFSSILWLFTAVFILYFIRKACNIDRWHGPADAVYASHRTDNELDLKRGVGSTFAALVSLSAGAPVGQYGPLVNFGASIASFLSQISRVKMIPPDVLMSCGVAAAISAGFNAPIGGIIFAHEAVLRHFSLSALLPIAIASTISAAFGTWAFGGAPLFSLNLDAPDLLPLLPSLVLSGFVFGIVALIYMRMIFMFAAISAKSGTGYLPLALIAALVTGAFGIFYPEVLGLGVDVIFSFINHDLSVKLILILLGLKILLTTLCIGFGVFGGVFSPALFIGAATGQAMSNLLSQIYLFSPSAVLAVSGMAAVAACVVGAPLAVVMIILELTMSYDYAIAALISTMVAVMVTNSIYGHSFFDKQLELRGIDLSEGRGNLELMGKKVDSILTQDYLTVFPEEKIGPAIKKMSLNGNSEAYCLDGEGRFLGKCMLSNIVHTRKTAMIKDHLELNSTSIKSDASIMQAIEVASNFVGESIPVLSRVSGKLKGVVTEADIFQAYMATQVKINDLERR
jgi:CIC family chloride channel protein